MSYSLVPANSGDTLLSTRDLIRENFSIIQQRFNENHVDIDGGSGGGKHKYIQIGEQSSAPATAVNEGALYTKQAGTAAKTALFFREESSGTELQLTDPDRLIGTEGSIMICGGLILKYGIKTNPGTSGTISFTTQFPTNIYNIQLTLLHNSSGNESVTVRNDAGHEPATDKFEYRSTSSSANTQLYWQAIGN